MGCIKSQRLGNTTDLSDTHLISITEVAKTNSAPVKITKKGQGTIPKTLTEKLGFNDGAIVVQTEGGVLLKPFPSISEEKGSLKKLFEGKTTEEIIAEVRRDDRKKGRRSELR